MKKFQVNFKDGVTEYVSAESETSLWEVLKPLLEKHGLAESIEECVTEPLGGGRA